MRDYKHFLKMAAINEGLANEAMSCGLDNDARMWRMEADDIRINAAACLRGEAWTKG